MLLSPRLSTLCHIRAGFSPLQKPPPASSLYTLPAVCRYLLGGAASDVKLEEAGVNGRRRGATTIWLLFYFPVLTLLISLT